MAVQIEHDVQVGIVLEAVVHVDEERVSQLCQESAFVVDLLKARMTTQHLSL